MPVSGDLDGQDMKIGRKKMRRLFQNLAFDLIAVAVVGVLAVVIGWGISRHSISMPPPQERKTAQTARVTIRNDAASADRDGKINGLRVYDPDSDNLAEYADGSQQPLGSHVSIYVYNLASDVHLTIRHKGEIFANDDFPRLEDEKKVKFFDLILEGDLEVESREINLKNQQGIATVHINDSSLALVTSDGQEWNDGQDIAFGRRNITIGAKDRDLKAQIRVGDRVAATKVILKGQTVSVEDLNIDGDLFFQLAVASADEVKAEQETEQEEAKARSEGGDPGQTKPDPGKTDLSKDQAKPDIRNQDRPQGQIKPGTGKQSQPQKQIKPGTGNQGQSGGQIRPDAGGQDKSKEDEGKGSAQGGSQKPDTGDQGQSGGQIRPEKKCATVTIQDASGSVFVEVLTDDGTGQYELKPENRERICSGTRLPTGTRIVIFKYYDPDYPGLKVTHRGRCIVDRENDPGLTEGYDSLEIIELTLEGDLVVTSTPFREGSRGQTGR